MTSGRASPADAFDAAAAAKRLVPDSLKYAAAKVVPAIAGLATLLVGTRVLSAEAYGAYVLVLSTATLVSASLFAWLRQAIFRFFPRYGEQGLLAQALPQVNTLAAGTAGISGLVAGGALALQGLPAHLAVLGSALTVGLVVYGYCATILQSVLRPGGFIALSAAQAGAQALLLLIFLSPDSRTAGTLAIVLVASYAVASLAYALSLKRPTAPRCCARPGRELSRDFLSYGLPMVGWFFVTQVLNVGDRYVIDYFCGAGDVGVYSASYSLATSTFAILTMPLLIAMHPIVMSVWEHTRGAGDTAKILERTARVYMVGALPLLAFGWVTYDDIARVSLGEQFWNGSLVFPLVTAGLFASGLGNYAHKGLELHNRTATMFTLAAVSAGVNVALNVLLVPVFGYLAAAYTTLASMWLYLLLAFASARRHVKWSMLSGSGAKAAASSVMAAAAVCGLHRSALAGSLPPLTRVMMAAALFAIVYAGGLLVSGVVRLDAIRCGWGALRGRGRP